MPVWGTSPLHNYTFKFSKGEEACVLVRQQCVLRPSRVPLDQSSSKRQIEKEGPLSPKSLKVAKESRCTSISLAAHSCKKLT